ncbi:EscT/YscT/HrcT family type III secretion system export apparatus protein, partial [Shigella sonnei]|nr:EscT/YscT/HrcT family type III secretion system export apparatus protein [Shigella sonnei]
FICSSTIYFSKVQFFLGEHKFFTNLFVR